MAFDPRVLPPRPVARLADYEQAGGGQGLEAAARLGPDGVIDEVAASGLRGRGGAGFPTGRKWAAVSGNVSPVEPTTVVVNGAEGEPGSFKDRAIMRADPYRVLEGALIAAFALSADTVIVAVKETFTAETERLRAAIEEIHAAGWATDVELSVFEGPPEYLYGEETGLLEAVDGRGPFPRVSPPYRHGAEEFGDEPASSAAKIEMAAPGELTDAPPTLANNVETLANVPGILARGADWFRSVGTDGSPGTIVCTVTGQTPRHGVAEVAMGTPLRDVIDQIGGGALPGRRHVAAMSGVANSLVLADDFDVPVSYEAMQAIGTGLGTGGFIVFDDTTDFVAVAAGVSRFLGVESCGQCVPCKQDGLELAAILERMCKDTANEADLAELDTRIGTVADSARCNLALQHQLVVGNIRRLFPDEARDHTHADARPVEPELIAAIVDIEDGRAVLDERQREKQPDWTYDPVYSGKWPATRFTQRSTEAFE
ncbi:MAG TPA: NADH-ubiquinone oxidoreductase-F iron-sulfur binding region domain-containing protein [Acidimicrobiia bacterium]|nr:NADH-ubiquinone oxidoreductase-F iron-sulfur binding region domain-containing protein [Acidimicrobiia bacterium]